MSEQPGGSTPNAFVFPPFAPPVFRAPAPPAPAALAPAAPVAVPPEEPTEDFGMEVPLPAHDVGDPDDLPQQGFDAEEADSQPWETPAPPAAEDLPWLEMPADGPRVHPAEVAAPAEPSWESILAPADDEPAPQRFGEVADRLESIARALREDPDGFLAGNSADPLGLLVTGFVLGYSRR